MNTAPIAILSALAEEQDGLLQALTEARCVRRAGRDYWCGQLRGHPVVLALSRIGKVAAATTAAALLEHFQARAVLFTGVAGGVGANVNVGDVVLARQFVQHDMNAAPLFPRYEVPLTATTVWPTDTDWSERLLQAARHSLMGAQYEGHTVQIHQGLIATGDQFVCAATQATLLCQDLNASGHSALAVEMEGAAVAQVCADYGVPFAAVRTISDRADDSAHVDFPQFVRSVASVYARRIMLKALEML